MGEYNDDGYTASTAGELTAVIQQAVDENVGAQDYGTAEVPTIAGGWTLAMGGVESAREERDGLIVDAIDPRRARGAHLDSHAAAVNKQRQAATSSTYIVRAITSSGVALLTVGDLLQDDTSDARLWSVSVGATVTTSETQITIECAETGPIALPSTVGFRLVTPVANAPTVSYDSSDGDNFAIGFAREQDPGLRVRMSRAYSTVPSPTKDGIRAGLLALTWVVAASVVRTDYGKIAVYVYPAAVGSAQEQEAVNVVGFRRSSGTSTVAGTGTTYTQDYTLSDGTTDPDAILITVPSAQTVAVVIALAYASGTSSDGQAAARTDAEAVVASVFSALDVGQTLEYAAMFCAVYGVENVTGLALTLDGSAADVAASTSATQIASGAVTIT